MSRLNLSENLFLEVNELNKILKFITNDGYKRIFKSIIKNYGIVEDDSNTYFKVTQKSDNVVTINSGLAFDSNLDAIVLNESVDLTVSDTGTKRWIILSRATSHLEDGTISITSDGVMTGINTKFTEILRGQPNFPVKIKFVSNNNTGEYEVVSVSSDTSAILSGAFSSESGIRFSVIGTFTPGFQPDSNNKEIYEYDSYSLSIQDSDSKPTVSEDEFILACVYYVNDVMYIIDERVYCIFNQKYTQNSNVTGISPLTSLLAATVISGIDCYKAKSADIELILEHGYKVISYELNSTVSYNVFQVTSGTSNFYGSGDIPNNIFDGWLLLNRKNMKYSEIDYNIGKYLYISNFNSEMIAGDNEFVIVPNFSEIEYEVKLNNSVISPDISFYFKNSIANPYTRLRVYALFPTFGGENSVTFTIRYRFIDETGKKYAFQNLSVASFTNTKGISEILANSSFNINMAEIEPQAPTQNYS